MRIFKAMTVGMIAFSFIAQNARGADAPGANEKNQSLFVKSTPPKNAETSDTFEKILSDAEALLNSGRPNEAYVLLAPMDFEYSGNNRFDYLLGISALDSGHPDKATLAFERVLAVDPNFAGARLDMARAYFHLGDMARAKVEFLAVMKQGPPEAARLTIEKYIQAIADLEQAKKNNFSASVQSAIGHDSNVNNSPSQADIIVPAFGNLVFTLSPTNLQTPDNYYSAGAGGELNLNLSNNWGTYAGIDLQKRGNSSMTDFDTSSVDTHAGVVLNYGVNNFRFGATLGDYTLAETAYRTSEGLIADWRHSYSQSEQLNVFAQYGRNRFAQTVMQINDFDQDVIGTGWQHIFTASKTALFGSINWGNERAANDRADGNKIGYGLRVGGQIPIRESIEAYANAGYQRGSYDKENLAFLTNRIDVLYDATVGGNWHFAKFWIMRPQVVYSMNNSNIPIYGFNRLDASITVRRDF